MKNLLNRLFLLIAMPLLPIIVSCEKDDGQITVSQVAADFSAVTTNILANKTVTFSDKSSGDVTHWSWSFEGGTPAISHEKNPIVTYKTAGKFDVKLVVSNSKYTDQEIKSEYVDVRP